MSALPTVWMRIEPAASLSLDRRGSPEDGKEFDHAAILVGIGNEVPISPGTEIDASFVVHALPERGHASP